MKICYLSDANSIHTQKWCQFFKGKGYEVHVISLNEGSIPGVKVHSLNMNIDKVQGDSYLSKFKYIIFGNKVKKLLEDIKPDILHAHYASSYGFLGGATGFHPYIISLWGSDIYEFPRKNFVFRKFIERNLKKADIILSTSRVMAEEAKKYTDKNIEITPFGVDIEIFKPQENRVKSSERIIIGTIKAFEKPYGIEYLIRAFAELSKKYKNIYLELGGKGSQQGSYEALVKELGIEGRVKFLGFISSKEVVKAFNRFHIAVFPSIFESFGVAAVEAQACGIPLIISDAAGLMEAASPGRSSILVEKENVQQLEEAMEKLINSEKLRNEMGNFGRIFVEENYNIKDNFNKVDSLYRRITMI